MGREHENDLGQGPRRVADGEVRTASHAVLGASAAEPVSDTE